MQIRIRNHAAVLQTEVILRRAREIVVILFSAALVAAGLKLFLTPHQLLSGGVAGLASIIGYVFGYNVSWFYFALNLPLLIWGWMVLGKRFIVLSIISVFSTTWIMEMLPDISVTKDPIMGAIFGGILIAIGSGYSLRVGGSTGGFDILGAIVTRKRDFPVGTVLFILNGIVILVLGYYKNWDLALYSMLCTYVKGKVVDMIHIRHIKVTCFIITQHKDRMLNRLLQLPHGVTLMNTEGGYSHKSNAMLMTVTTRYELAEVRKAIREADPGAFVNVVETVEVLGRFVRQPQ